MRNKSISNDRLGMDFWLFLLYGNKDVKMVDSAFYFYFL